MSAIIILGSITLGACIGFALCAILSAGKRADEAMEQEMMRQEMLDLLGR